MKNLPFKLVSGLLIGAALFFTACGKKTSDEESPAAAQEIEIPETPADAIQSIVREVAKGNGAVLWQAMPASYQNDVNELAQLAGTKVDSEIYGKVFATISRIAEVADKQKEFLFHTGLGTAPPEGQIEKLREAWPSIMNLFNTITDSSISSTESLQSFDGEAFFADTVSSLLLDMDVLSKIKPDPEQPPLSAFAEAVVTYVEGTDEQCTLEMAMPNGEIQIEDFIKVEGSWVPQDMAADWTTKIGDARAQLEGLDPAQIAQQKPQILSVFAMIDGVLGQIDAAESQEQFDQALQGAMMPLMGLMMMGQGMGGGAPAMPAMPAMPVAPVAP